MAKMALVADLAIDNGSDAMAFLACRRVALNMQQILAADHEDCTTLALCSPSLLSAPPQDEVNQVRAFLTCKNPSPIGYLHVTAVTLWHHMK
jgi:hypothetical protein